MDVRKNVMILYLIVFFHNLIPAYVIERLFWQDRGMTVLMVVYCEIIYAAVIVLSEIPTGVLADRFGRKILIVIGGLFSLLEMIILLFAHSFWSFALAVGLAGIAGACVSGALNALLYDSLLERKEEKSFEKIVGRMNAIDLIGSIIAALSGSVIARWFGLEFNYILSASSLFLAFLFTLRLREPQSKQRDLLVSSNHIGVKAYLISSFAFFKSHPKLILIVIQAMGISACITYLDEFWQLYLDEIGFSLLFFGVFSAILSLVKIPGNLLASRFLEKYSAGQIIIGVLFIITAGLFLTAMFPGPLGMIVIVIIFLASGVIDPVITGYVHHRTDSTIRATVESVQSLLERGITLSIGLGFGLIATRVSVTIGFAYLGAVSLAFLVWMLVKSNKFRVLHQ
ncbi:MFS transporter [Fredinandcohnia sp. 179-A 10B2 NHS]|uniref:MFS transporter n=1 Tax=Fredinandcohnia sp. 179-A 10B2 NHS TaxID=3235176 RepID=UPI00399F1003